jgi:HPt (histidine-containing phosphotransfer) domain-containing protein
MNTKNLVLIDPDLEDIIPEYLENIEETLVFFLEAIEKSDFEGLRREGHKLKGHGKAYGFEMISTLGARIESFAKASEMEEIKVQVNNLKDYMANLEIKYNK